MTKNLRYFCTLLLMAVVGVAWAQTTHTIGWGTASGDAGTFTNFTETSGAVQGVLSFTAAKNDAGSPPAYNANASELRLYYNGGGNGGSITITPADGITITDAVITTSTSPAVAYYVDGGSATSVTGSGNTYTISNISASSSLEIKNVNTTNTQLRIKTIAITYTSGGSTAVATTTTIDASGITNTDVYTSTAAGSLTATVTETESGNAVSGATVTWTSSKENVATIDEDGVVTLVAAGTTTITASYEGVSGEFGASSATYELMVTSSAPYEQPTEFEIGLNNALFGTEYTGSVSGITDDTPIVGTQDNVTVTYAGGGNHYVNDSQIRFYPNNKLTFEAPNGYEIKKIVFTAASNTWAATISANGGTYDATTKTWTGSATSVVFSGSGSSRCDMASALITLGEPSTDPTIDANNVNIAYDATEGEIAYTINNPVTGTLLQATADADWISNITVGESAITFNATANEANTARVATFTLTYEGAEDKTVTVTQAAAPMVYTTIPDLFAAATSTSTPVTITFNNWVISAVKGSNAYLTDNAGNGLIIYQSSHGFNVNDVLSGTASCNLVTYQGSAELTGLTASTEGLTVTPDGTVTEQNIAISALTGVNTGALLAYENLTYNGTALVDADNNAIEPYTTLYSGTFEADKVYNVKGIYKQYTTNTQDKKQILPRSADDIEEVVSDEPSITVTPNNQVLISGDAGSGQLEVVYHKVQAEVGLVEFVWCNADGSTPADENYALWLNANLDDEDVTVINYMVGDNDGPARTAYFKIVGLAEDTEEVVESVVSFTQHEFKPDYAYLPYQFLKGRDDIENENGLTQNGLGGDYGDTNSKLRFDGTGDYLVLKINPKPEYEYSPKAITFNIKGNNFSGGTFAVQVSEDGETYTDLATYTDSEITSSNQTITLLNTNDNVKYIKWIYTEKVQGGGNIGIGNIYVDDEYLVRGNATVSEDLTLAACEIESEGKLTIESGATLTVTEPYALYNGGNSSNLVIKDGGQLKTPNEVFATVEKEIIGYTQDNYYTNKGYYLVSAPAEKYLYVASSNADVDAYMFDASEEGEEWRNFKGAQGAWNISASSAILYATKENSTLSLDGQGIVYNQPNTGANEVANKVPATTTNIDIDIRFNSGKAFEGYNLIGNPFTCTAYLADGREFLRMNEDGDGFVWTSGAISVCEGIFVVAESSSDNKVTFTTTNPTDGNAGPAALTLNLTQSRGNVIDNARIRFGEGRNYAKFALNESNARVSFTQGNKEYSLVRSNGQGEMPVSFKAAQNGTYTLSFDMENVAFDNLRLIDNLTGVETDLLAAPSYTFTARTTDYASRFRLVFSANNVNQNAENDTFAYFNGSEWVINGSDNATVQVIDMMGRVVLSGTNTIATNDMQAGVYVIRLVDGNNVKTQKIVVE